MNSNRKDYPLPVPLTSRTPLPRFRAASAARRGYKFSSASSRGTSGSSRHFDNMDIDSEPTPNATSNSSLADWDDEPQIAGTSTFFNNPESYNTFPNPYEFISQPPYSPPHSPRDGMWYGYGLESGRRVLGPTDLGRSVSPDTGDYDGSLTETRPSPDLGSNADAGPMAFYDVHTHDGPPEMRRVEENLELIRQDDQDLDSASQSKSRSRSQPHQLSHLLNDEYPVVSQAQSTKGKGKAKALDVPEDEEVKDEVEVESFESVGVYSARQKGKSSKAKGKQKASVAANLSSNIPTTSTSTTSNTSSSSIPSDILAQLSLSSYTCPICFCAPTNATVTPCGHIACGSCLFTAVKTALRRETMMGTKDDGGPRCPVCRATIPGWDGKGGGVIGLVMQTITVA